MHSLSCGSFYVLISLTDYIFNIRILSLQKAIQKLELEIEIDSIKTREILYRQAPCRRNTQS